MFIFSTGVKIVDRSFLDLFRLFYCLLHCLRIRSHIITHETQIRTAYKYFCKKLSKLQNISNRLSLITEAIGRICQDA